MKELKNKEVLKKVIEKAQERMIDSKGDLATITDEAFLGVPSRVSERIKKIISKHKEKYPTSASIDRGIGTIAGVLGAGGLGARGLRLIPSAAKVLKGGKIGKAALEGAVYGGSYPALKEGSKGNIEGAIIEGLSGAGGGALLGAGLGVGGRFIKGLAKKIKVAAKGKKALAREKIEGARKNLASQLTKDDYRHIKKILKDGTDSFGSGKLDTLVHNPTARTKAISDALYLTSPKVRTIIDIKKENLGKEMEGMLEEAFKRASGVGEIPNVEKFTELIRRRGIKQAEPLYKKAKYKEGKPIHIELDEIIKNEPYFEQANKAAFSKTNKLNRKIERENSMEVLDRTKQKLDDMISAKARAGEDNEKRIITKIKNGLLEKMDKESPIYKEARGVAEKYLTTREAGKLGREFLKENEREIPELVKGYDDNSKLAYKLGALTELLDKVGKNAQNAEFGQIARHITNPKTARKLEKILPKEKADRLQSDAEKVHKAIESMGLYTQGSQTARHEANKNIAPLVIRATIGDARSKLTLANKLYKKMKGITEKDAEIGIRALLKPKRLLKYENMEIKRKPNKYAGKLGAIYTNMGEF